MSRQGDLARFFWDDKSTISFYLDEIKKEAYPILSSSYYTLLIKCRKIHSTIGQRMKLKLQIILLMFFLSQITFGEFRVWSDRNGHTLEAEFVSESAGKIVIKTKEGVCLKVPKEKLSDADQKYLESAIPPEIDIAFSKNQDRFYDGYMVDMTCKIVIKKTSQFKYTGKLTAILLVVGRDQRYKIYSILEKAKDDFDFKESDEFVLQTKSFRMYQDSSISSGTVYTGFLAVVMDEKGNVIAEKSNRKEFIKNRDKLILLKKGSKMDRKFEKR